MNKSSIFIVLVMVTALTGQTHNEIIKKTIEAHGGVEAIEKYQYFSAEGSLRLFMYGREFFGDFEYIQSGNKSRQKYDIDFGGEIYTLIYAYNGKTAFIDQFGDIADSPSLNYEGELDHTIQLLLDSTTNISLGKDTEINGAKVSGIQVERDGKLTTFYIDQRSYQIAEIVFRDSFISDDKIKETFEKRIIYQDYRKIENVIFPMKCTFFEKDLIKKVLSFSKILFAPDIDESLFERPSQNVDTRYWEEKME